MTRKRRVLRFLAWLTGLLLLVAVASVFVVRSQWFYQKIRLNLIGTMETATGGRVEIGSFAFHWTRLRAEVQSLVIHGNEPAGKPPLLRASSIAVGLKIVSLIKRDVDIQYLHITDPHIYLIVYPDGHTNVPEPRTKPRSDRNPVETILALAVGQFDIRNGVFEVESRGKTPFEARGQKLSARFDYELTGPRYRGQIAIQPLELRLPGLPPLPLGINTVLAIEKNRIAVTNATLTNGGSRVELSGAIEDLAAPHGIFPYNAHIAVAEAARFLKIEELDRGTVDVGGTATWAGGTNISANGNLRSNDVEYRDSLVRLSGYRLSGALTANLQGVDLNSVHLSGMVSSARRCTAPPCLSNIPVEGRVANITVRGRGDLDLHRVAMNVLGGNFQGEARLRTLDRYTVDGDVSGFDARRVVALYSPEPLPWNALASGPVHLEGSFRRKIELKASGNLAIAPAAEGAPVHGQINAAYEVRTGILDLGRSTVTLPSSRADFSGAFGTRMQVHFESRDLNDILPVLGQSASTMPVKLENGTARFDGTISGKLDHPQFDGHLAATRVSYSGKLFDSVEGDASASPDRVQMSKTTVVRGSLHAEFQASATLDDWKATGPSAISANGTIRNASLSELATLLDIKDLPATGTLTATGQLGGTIDNPTAAADLDLSKGAFRDETFDRLVGHVTYAGRRIVLSSGQINAGAKQVQLAGAFTHLPDHLDTGRLRFQVSSNVMPLDQIHTLQQIYPGVRGTAQVSADGEAELAPAANGPMLFRLAELQADVAAKSLQLTGQSLGDTHLTATSQGQVLRAHLESDFADSEIRGDGEWRLDGDYPGSGMVRFSKLDFARLRAWATPSDSAATRVTGSVEGELHFQGPALKPAAMKAELRIPKFSLGPAPGTVPAGGAITLTNSGPIVASMTNYVVTVESARLVGRSTDLTVSGKVLLEQKNPLDLRVNGKVDLELVQDFDSDLVAAGTVTADATVRGAFDAPLFNGRVQVQDASFGLNDMPIGISKANGVVLLTNDRATIQNFSGETGGGKIQLSGFAGYSGGETIFRFHARAEQVRVRYPEGVSTVANGSLNLTGTPDRSMLEGSVTILRTGFNLQSDFSSLIAQSAEPVRTPAARTGLLGGLNFDIQINTDPDIQLQSALTEDLQAEANLRLRGTASNPAIVGRVNITQGQVVFYGTKYRINQGTVAFYNPLKVEPILDIDLETKAHGIDITLTVAGPLNKLHLTPRSDPPLQFSEIVALLATGRTPTSDPTLLAQQSTAPQSWQQMGATALLGQAIANPVSGRLQRFFGVSKLRIDPTLPGVENNPQARLTLEQQVTPDITFTYITNVTSSNPQVVRMEWSFSKQWSVVALRDENGTFGLDFFFKKRF